MDRKPLLTKVNALFATPEVLSVPSADTRYRYKKVGGSSDTKTTYDSIS